MSSVIALSSENLHHRLFLKAFQKEIFFRTPEGYVPKCHSTRRAIVFSGVANIQLSVKNSTDTIELVGEKLFIRTEGGLIDCETYFGSHREMMNIYRYSFISSKIDTCKNDVGTRVCNIHKPTPQGPVLVVDNSKTLPN